MGTTLLVIGYALIWLVLMAYLGWLTLRMRGVRADLEAAREIIERRAGSDAPAWAQGSHAGRDERRS